MELFSSSVLPPVGATFTVREVAQMANISLRTIRHYVGERVLPAAELRSSKTRYGRAFLVRLRAAITLRARGLHVRGVREQLAEATMAEMLKLAGYDAAPGDEMAPDLRGAESGVTPRASEAAARGKEAAGRGGEVAARGGTASGAGAAGRALPAGFLGAYRAGAGPAHESWEHFEVCPGVKLLVRREADPEAWRVAEEIVAVFGGGAPAYYKS